ncbi:MAG: ATP-binding cassette domain-containing protein [Bacilli bacterium]|nr:ATP-binding cassette domain-containing protein [Bacilli bacterium]
MINDTINTCSALINKVSWCHLIIKITDDEIIEVCQKIGLHDKIMSLDKGYNTIIDIYTDKLSYGEKQLLNFARAILKDADILILDEVTSNLDL